MEKYLIKSDNEISLITEAGRILAVVLEKLRAEVRPGVSLKDLDKMAHDLIKQAGGEPAFLGYRPEGAQVPYPATICASVNSSTVHGVPTDYKIKSNDLVKIDVGVRFKGYNADAAITVAMPDASAEGRKLIAATEAALKSAIEVTREGNTIGDIGFTINEVVRANGFRVIKILTGHGIGKRLHEDPSVYNYGQPRTGLALKAGMVLAIEPITAVSTERVRQMPDDSFVTSDGSLAAHFEHTVVITSAGPKVVTELDKA